MPNTFESLVGMGIDMLKDDNIQSAHIHFGQWNDYVATWLNEKFKASGMAAEWSALSYSPLMAGNYANEGPRPWAEFRKAVQVRLQWLSRIPGRKTVAEEKAEPTMAIRNTRKVFIVHGHNEALRERVARFVAALDLEPVILHEQASQNRTVIEKLYGHAEVDFAIVLLTADDQGAILGADVSDMRPRARQNVILELGLFMGLLGREKVCALLETDVEIPSDYAGVIYIAVDGDDWKLKLAKEIRASGVSIDMNRAV